MQRSENINELIAALAKAQAAYKPIKKEVENPYFKSKYADLSAIIEATQPALNANGLVLTQLVRCQAELAITEIESILFHSSGQFISEILHLPAGKQDKFDPQSIGSSQTYGRRYAMQAILGVAAEPDDDGNAASNKGSKEAAQAVGASKVEEIKQKIASLAARKDIGLAGNPAAETPQNGSGEVYGLLKAAKRIKLKNNKGNALALEILDPNDKATALFCFDNREYPGGMHLFDLLEMAAEGKGQAVRLRTKASGKFTNVIAPIAIGNVNFDEDGVPIIERDADPTPA
jgi:hypothetical protein